MAQEPVFRLMWSNCQLIREASGNGYSVRDFFYQFGPDSKDVLGQLGTFASNESPYTVFVYEVRRAWK